MSTAKKAPADLIATHEAAHDLMRPKTLSDEKLRSELRAIKPDVEQLYRALEGLDDALDLGQISDPQNRQTRRMHASQALASVERVIQRWEGLRDTAKAFASKRGG